MSNCVAHASSVLRSHAPEYGCGLNSHFVIFACRRRSDFQHAPPSIPASPPGSDEEEQSGSSHVQLLADATYTEEASIPASSTVAMVLPATSSAPTDTVASPPSQHDDARQHTEKLETMAQTLRFELGVEGPPNEVASKAATILRVPHSPELSDVALMQLCLDAIGDTEDQLRTDDAGVTSSVTPGLGDEFCFGDEFYGLKPLPRFFAENNIHLPAGFTSEEMESFDKHAVIEDLFSMLIPCGGLGEKLNRYDHAAFQQVALALGVGRAIAKHPPSPAELLVLCIKALVKWDPSLWSREAFCSKPWRGGKLHDNDDFVSKPWLKEHPSSLASVVYARNAMNRMAWRDDRDYVEVGRTNYRSQQAGPFSGLCDPNSPAITVMTGIVAREMGYNKRTFTWHGDPWAVALQAACELGLHYQLPGKEFFRLMHHKSASTHTDANWFDPHRPHRTSNASILALLSMCMNEMMVPHVLESAEWLQETIGWFFADSLPRATPPTAVSNPSLQFTPFCFLLSLPSDLLLLVRGHLINALEPAGFCSLSASCMSLRVCTREIYWQLRVAHWRAQLLCAHTNTAARPSLAPWTCALLRTKAMVRLDFISTVHEDVKSDGEEHRRRWVLFIPHSTIESMESLGALAESFDATQGLTVNVAPYDQGQRREAFFPKPAALNDMMGALLRLRGRGFPSLQVLSLHGVMCDKTGATRLAQVLDAGHMPLLERLHMNDAQMTASCHTALAPALRRRLSLKDIWLGGNILLERAVVALLMPAGASFDTTATFKELQSVSFGHALPNLATVRIFTEALKSGSLPKLGKVRVPNPCSRFSSG